MNVKQITKEYGITRFYIDKFIKRCEVVRGVHYTLGDSLHRPIINFNKQGVEKLKILYQEMQIERKNKRGCYENI